eukprot:3944568-Pyramimonas_sp.AAC.3
MQATMASVRSSAALCSARTTTQAAGPSPKMAAVRPARSAAPAALRLTSSKVLTVWTSTTRYFSCVLGHQAGFQAADFPAQLPPGGEGDGRRDGGEGDGKLVEVPGEAGAEAQVP